MSPDTPGGGRVSSTGASKLASDRMESSPARDRGEASTSSRQDISTESASPPEEQTALPINGDDHRSDAAAAGQRGPLGARVLQSQSTFEDQAEEETNESGRVLTRSLPQLDYARPAVLEDQRRVARAWRARPLEVKYAAIYVGVIDIVVKEGPLVHRKKLSVITALTMSGAREVIGLDTREDCESEATNRPSELLERGLQDVLAIVIDNPVQADAWAACFPRSRMCPSIKAVATDFGIRGTAFIKGIERLVESAVAGADRKRAGSARRRSSHDPFESDPQMSPAEREKLARYVSDISGFPEAWRRVLFVRSAVSPVKARLHSMCLRLPTSFPDESSALDRMSLIMRMLSTGWRLAPIVWSPIKRRLISEPADAFQRREDRK